MSTYKAALTLSSHSGKGLKVSEKKGEDNEAKYHLTLSEDGASSLEATVTRENHSSSLFLVDGQGEYQLALTVVDHEFGTGSEVVLFSNRRELRQQFVVNNDLTVSASCCPTCVLGLNEEDSLCLVPKDNEKRLVFDSLKPQYNLAELKIMPLVPTSHPNIGICHASFTRQHGHGRETYLELGDPQKAMRVFIDEDDHIMDADLFCQNFDAY